MNLVGILFEGLGGRNNCPAEGVTLRLVTFDTVHAVHAPSTAMLDLVSGVKQSYKEASDRYIYIYIYVCVCV